MFVYYNSRGPQSHTFGAGLYGSDLRQLQLVEVDDISSDTPIVEEYVD